MPATTCLSSCVATDRLVRSQPGSVTLASWFVHVRTALAVALSLLVAAVVTPADAQQAGGGFLGKSRSEYSVYVFGDSLAAGLWAGSRRVAAGIDRLKISGRFKEGSGLARPKFHDWTQAIPKIIESNQIDIAIIFMGSNDGQLVKQDDATLEFATPEWETFYAGRVDQLLDILKKENIAVYWMGLPPMGQPRHDEAVKVISRIQRERVHAARQRYVEVRKHFADENDQYNENGFDVDGQFRRLRSREGFKFLKSGNTKVAKLAIDAIMHDIEVSDGVRAPDPESLALAAPSDREEMPIFGHALNTGEAFIVDPADLPKSDAVAIARRPGQAAPVADRAPDEVIQALRTSAKPDSAAARLFIDGEWPDAPEGRLDDFRLTAE